MGPIHSGLCVIATAAGSGSGTDTAAGSGALAAPDCHSLCCCNQTPVPVTAAAGPSTSAVAAHSTPLMQAGGLEEGLWEPGVGTFLLPSCPILETDLDAAITALWAHRISGAYHPSRLLKFSVNGLWPYRRRTKGCAGVCPKGLDGDIVFVCADGGGEALAAGDADKGTLSTTCCLCNKSCPRGEGGFDSPALLHAHYHLRQLVNKASYDRQRCGFCCGPAEKCPVTLAPFSSPCLSFNSFKLSAWDDKRGCNTVLKCLVCGEGVWRFNGGLHFLEKHPNDVVPEAFYVDTTEPVGVQRFNKGHKH